MVWGLFCYWGKLYSGLISPPVRSEADSEHDNTSPTWTAAMLNKKTGLSLHQLKAHYVN